MFSVQDSYQEVIHQLTEFFNIFLCIQCTINIYHKLRKGLSSQLAVMNLFPDVLGRASSLFNWLCIQVFFKFLQIYVKPPWHLALKETQVPPSLNASILLIPGSSPLSTPKWPTVGQQTGFPQAPALPLR